MVLFRVILLLSSRYHSPPSSSFSFRRARSFLRSFSSSKNMNFVSLPEQNRHFLLRPLARHCRCSCRCRRRHPKDVVNDEGKKVYITAFALFTIFWTRRQQQNIAVVKIPDNDHDSDDCDESVIAYVEIKTSVAEIPFM